MKIKKPDNEITGPWFGHDSDFLRFCQFEGCFAIISVTWIGIGRLLLSQGVH